MIINNYYTVYVEAYIFILETFEKLGVCYRIMLIHALISCRLVYCNVHTHKTDRLQRIQNQCACILTKSPRRERITPVLKSLH